MKIKQVENKGTTSSPMKPNEKCSRGENTCDFHFKQKDIYMCMDEYGYDVDIDK